MEINDISFSYPANQQAIIDHLSYSIQPNAITSIAGPNGSGKTTLLRILARELVPSHGEVTLLNQSISSYAAKEYAQKVAIVHQHNPLYEDISSLT